MSRRVLVFFLLFVMLVVASACSALGFHGRQNEASAVPLVRLPEAADVQYGQVYDIPPDAKAQTVTFKDAKDQPQGFAIRTYPNRERLPLMSWISKEWDPGRLLFLRPCHSSIGDCVVVVDSTTYQTNEDPPQPDFPILAVAEVGDNVVAVNRLNGIPSQSSDILNLLEVVRE